MRAVFNILIVSLWGVFFSQAVSAFEFDLEGVYEGQMTLTDGIERVIPLSLSLVLTGETETSPDGGEENIIDGVVIVDGEGGPYSFSKVSLDIEDVRIDMRYNRPQRTPGSDVPSNFRLTGFFNQQGWIEGRVLSGVHGPIGSFVVKPTDKEVLSVDKKYAGHWQGMAQLTSGGEVPFKIVLNDSSLAYTNPANYEFDFTPGKIGSIKWNRSQIAISEVSIDYLRRDVVLYKRGSSGTTELSIQFKMDFVSGKITGAINSALQGRTATFTLDPVRDP